MEFPVSSFYILLIIIMCLEHNRLCQRVYLLGQRGWMYCVPPPWKKSINTVWPMHKIQHIVAFVKNRFIGAKPPFLHLMPVSVVLSLSPSLPLLPSFCLTFLSSALLSDLPRGFLFYWSFQRTYWRLSRSRLLCVHSSISLFCVYLWLCFTLLLISFLPELSHSLTCLQSYTLSD